MTPTPATAEPTLDETTERPSDEAYFNDPGRQAEHERVEALRKQLDQGYPESWIPSETDRELIGYMSRLEDGNTAYGPCKIVVLRDFKTGVERSVWLLHTVLRNEFKRCRPQPGELVAVRYDGKQRSGSGQTYDSYTVKVDRPVDSTTADWDSVPGDGHSPAGQAQAQPFGPEPTAADDDIPF